ncbi:MAG: DUF58 domain-containing protein [Bacteriovoracaceae bacterium]|nr:DUF58 domain-containing protein [Bacteriovoracaceae bacterium]
MNFKSWALRQFKKKARIYILPTKMGGYLNGLIFLMFLLSVGYSNNLLLIFTLILFGFNLMWLIQTHFYLNALKPRSLHVQDSFAKDSAMVGVDWQSTPGNVHQWEMSLETADESYQVTNDSVSFPHRGVLLIEHLKVSSLMPVGLYKAWIYFPVNVKVYVYPEKLKQSPLIVGSRNHKEGDDSSLFPGPHDFRNLAPYQGEETRKISWKHYARSGELVVKVGEELLATDVFFRIQENLQDKELELSIVATQMVACLKSETSFALETPHQRIPFGKSEQHLKQCLRELCQC